MLLGASQVSADLASGQWPMFRHDLLHTGRTDLPGPPALFTLPQPTPGLRWFQGGLIHPDALGAAIEEGEPFIDVNNNGQFDPGLDLFPSEYDLNSSGAREGHRPPGPQGAVFSSPAALPGPEATKVWYFHAAAWTDIFGAPIAQSQLRSEAPSSMSQFYFPSGLFATSAAIDFSGVTDYQRRLSLNFRNRDPALDTGFIPEATGDSPWRFVFTAYSDSPGDVTVRFRLFTFQQGSPALRTFIFETTPEPLLMGRRQYVVDATCPAIALGLNEGVAVDVVMTNAGSVASPAKFEFDGVSLSRIETPIVRDAVYVGADDGSIYALDASNGNVLWARWLGVPGLATRVRSSPAVDTSGNVYVGVEQRPAAGESFSQGRLFSLRDDSSLRWAFPASERVLYLRNATDPAFPAQPRRMMSISPGAAPNTDTFASTGTSRLFTQFLPGATSSPGVRLPFLTQRGWLASSASEFPNGLVPSGLWHLTIGYSAIFSGNPPRALIWYRISKVVVDAGTGQVGYGAELVGWTQAPEQQILQPPPGSSGKLLTASFDTGIVPETVLLPGEWLFLELGIEQTLAPSGTSGWRLVVDDPDLSTRLTTGLVSDDFCGAITSSPAVGPSDVIYFGDKLGFVRCLEGSEGAGELLVWEVQVESGRSIEFSSPALDTSRGNGRVYLATTEGRVYAFDALSPPRDAGGHEIPIWRFPSLTVDPTAPIGAVESSPAVGPNGDIYIGSDDGKLRAIKPDGSLRWEFPSTAFPLPGGGTAVGPIRSSAALSRDGRTIYFGASAPPADKAGLYAVHINSDGSFDRLAGLFLMSGGVRSSPAVSTGLAPLHLFLRADSEFWALIPAPDRFRLGPLYLPPGQWSIPVQDYLPRMIPDPVGSPGVMPQNGWLTPGLAAGDVLTAGPWTLSVDLEPTGAQAGRKLYYRISRVRIGGDTRVVFQELLSQQGADAEGWVDAAVSLGTARSTITFTTRNVNGTTIASGDRLYVEVAIPRTDPAEIWRLFDSAGSFVRTAGFGTPGAETVFFGSDSGRAFSARMRFTGTDPTGFDVLPVWLFPEVARYPFTSSPAVGGVEVVGGGSDPVLYIGGTDSYVYALGTMAATGPGTFLPPLPPAAALRTPLDLTKSADKNVAETNSEITYTLRFSNAAPPLVETAAHNIVISDVLPAEVEYVQGSGDPPPSSAPPPGSPGGTITWNLSGLEPGGLIGGGSGQVRYRARVVAAGYPADNPPKVEMSTSPFDPEDEPAPFDLAHRTFHWGDSLYIRVTGRGQAVQVQNQASITCDYLTAPILSGVTELSNAVRVRVGWGNRYLLTFSYGPENNPTTGQALNQIRGAAPLKFETKVQLTAQGVRAGTPEWAFERAAPVSVGGVDKYVTVFRVRLAPRGYAFTPAAGAVTDSPNRPWTPYFWRAAVQQSTGAATGREAWGPGWERNEDPGGGGKDLPVEFDFRIRNPLEVEVDPAFRDRMNPALPHRLLFEVTPGIGYAPGARTPLAPVIVRNRSHHPLVGSGILARNIVRWLELDLGQQMAAFRDSGYDFRRENYIPKQLVSWAPGGFLSLNPGEARPIGISVEIPRYLSPGVYRAPSTGEASAAPAHFYVDLNANQTWDPGEAVFEHQIESDDPNTDWTGTYEPFDITVSVPLQAASRMAAETVDLGRAAAGGIYARITDGALEGAATLSVENIGNVHLTGTRGLDFQTRNDLRRSDTNVELLSAPPYAIPLPLSSGLVRLWNRLDTPGGNVREHNAAFPLTVAKTSVGSEAPFFNSARVTVGVLDGTERQGSFVIPHHQPSGSYRAVVATKLGDIPPSHSASFNLSVVEKRSTSAPGADFSPAGAWVEETVGTDTLKLFWSSTRRSDGATPPPGDFAAINAAQFKRTNVADDDPSNDILSYVPCDCPSTPYPQLANDPLPLPPAGVSRRHVAGSLFFDPVSRAQLFAWAGNAVRASGGSASRDGRLLWTDLTEMNPPACDSTIYDHPPVKSQNNPNLVDGRPTDNARIAQLLTSPGQTSQSAVIVSSILQSSGWQLRLTEIARAKDINTQQWGEWRVARDVALKTSDALSSSKDPSAFTYPVGHPAYDGLIHVIFSGRSRREANSDLFYARYAIGPGEPFTDANGDGAWNSGEYFIDLNDNGTYDADIDPLTEPRADARVPWPTLSETLSRRSAGKVFVARHLDWVVQGNYSVSPARLVTPAITVDETPFDLYPAFDAVRGRWEVRSFDGKRVEFDPLAGVVYVSFAATSVQVSYSPRLLRLTTHPGSDTSPSAFIETYRYRQAGAGQPEGFIPRLWVFWVRSGGPGLSPRIYFKTYRRTPDATTPADPLRASWLEEIRPNASIWAARNGLSGASLWPVDVGDRLVRSDHAANEFGICAVKDPRYPEVWLFWSSTRGIASGDPANPVTHDADIYYQVLAPALPPD
jgi:uncharacterized repeat protein (TIGR01451 family)